MIWKGVYVVDEEPSEEGCVLKGNQSFLSCPEVSVLEGLRGGSLRMWGLVVFKKCHEEIWEANCCMGLIIYSVNN